MRHNDQYLDLFFRVPHEEHLVLLDFAKEDLEALQYVVRSRDRYSDTTQIRETLKGMAASDDKDTQQLRNIERVQALYNIDLLEHGKEALSMALCFYKEKLAKYLIRQIFFDRLTDKPLKQNRNIELLGQDESDHFRIRAALTLLHKIEKELIQEGMDVVELNREIRRETLRVHYRLGSVIEPSYEDSFSRQAF